MYRQRRRRWATVRGGDAGIGGGRGEDDGEGPGEALPEADRGGAGAGAVHQAGVGCTGRADGPGGEVRPAGALPVPPAVWDRPTVLPAGAERPRGGRSGVENGNPCSAAASAGRAGAGVEASKAETPQLVAAAGAVGGAECAAAGVCRRLLRVGYNQPVTPKMVPVQGKVLWGSQPLTAGVVMFTPDAAAGNTSTLKPFGRIDANGTYRCPPTAQPGRPRTERRRAGI